jgi:hypothetical protein
VARDPREEELKGLRSENERLRREVGDLGAELAEAERREEERLEHLRTSLELIRSEC